MKAPSIPSHVSEQKVMRGGRMKTFAKKSPTIICTGCFLPIFIDKEGH